MILIKIMTLMIIFIFCEKKKNKHNTNGSIIKKN